MDVLELFSGIGGFAEALRGFNQTPTLASDISPHVVMVYRDVHGGECVQKNVITFKEETMAAFDWWWMSPPCKPHTRRGAQKDLEDHRSEPFQFMCHKIAQIRPRFLTVENVAGFLDSDAHARLREALTGYTYIDERVVCPTELGIPNKRPRFYLTASRDVELPPPQIEATETFALSDFIDNDVVTDALLVPERVVEKYGNVMHRAEVDGYATCFTSGYAKSWVYSGSFLTHDDRLRLFAPQEVARLLGFENMAWPKSFSLRQRYKYLGNSLSIPVVRAIIEPVVTHFSE